MRNDLKFAGIISEMTEIDAPESDYLYIAKSGIPKAGRGLFTAIPIFAAEIIAVFHGEYLDEPEANRRAIEGLNAYFISLPTGDILDSMYTECFAKYANDAAGIGKSKFKNNAFITLNHDDKPCLVAAAPIGAGEEIFCDYGKGYWLRFQNS